MISSTTSVQPVTHLLYLHGFRSSPQSTKARHMATVVARVCALGGLSGGPIWACPLLPASPAQAMVLLRSLVREWPIGTMAVMGSSLGGFYATVLAESLGCRAVLINPAVEPARDLARYIGEQTQWHDPATRFFFDPVYIDELRALRPAIITRPERYHVLMATGDEVLDWREMQARYAGCAGGVVAGSDHALSDFENHVPGILNFLAWPVVG